MRRHNEFTEGVFVLWTNALPVCSLELSLMYVLRPRVDVIERQRLTRGWTWAVLSKQSGLAVATIAKVLRGESVSVRTAARLAAAFQVRHTVLFAVERVAAVA